MIFIALVMATAIYVTTRSTLPPQPRSGMDNYATSGVTVPEAAAVRVAATTPVDVIDQGLDYYRQRMTPELFAKFAALAGSEPGPIVPNSASYEDEP